MIMIEKNYFKRKEPREDDSRCYCNYLRIKKSRGAQHESVNFFILAVLYKSSKSLAWD